MKVLVSKDNMSFLLQYVLEQYDNQLSKKFNDVVNEIRRQRCSYLRYQAKVSVTVFSTLTEQKSVLSNPFQLLLCFFLYAASNCARKEINQVSVLV